MSPTRPSAHQPDLGEKFFAIQSQLLAVLEDLCALCTDTDVEPARVIMLRNLISDLREPFLFIIAGGAGSGKSMLLNALFGQDFTSLDVDVQPGQIISYQYSREAHEFGHASDVLEVYRPLDFLKNFNLVDTQGNDPGDERHRQIRERFLPLADVVLFTFSVTEPWDSATWDLLDTIHGDYRSKVVIVLQQCDLRSSEEVAAILEHLQKTARHRFGIEFPIYAVSAREAYQQRSMGAVLGQQTAFGSLSGLESHLSKLVDSSPAKQQRLVEAGRTANAVLREVKGKLGNAIQVVKVDRELLSDLDPVITEQKNRTIKKCEPLFKALDDNFLAASLQAAPILEGQLHFISALSPSVREIGQMEDLLVATTMKSVRHTVNTGAKVVEEDVNHLYQQVSNEMHQHYHLALSVEGSGQPDWSESCQALADGVERASGDVLGKLDVKTELAQRLRSRSRVIWSYLIASGLAVMAGIALTLLGLGPWNAIAFGAAAIPLIIAIVYGAKSTHSIRQYYTATVNDYRAAVADAQREAFGIGTNYFFTDFTTLFDPIRELCQEHRERYEPQMIGIETCEKDLADMAESLALIESSLDR